MKIFKELMDEIQQLRGEIDQIDDEILALLIRRFDCVTKVANLKHLKKMPVFDGNREQELFERLKRIAEENGLHSDIVQSIFAEIIHQSRRVQEAEINLIGS